MIGRKPDDQKELHILNRTLRWCKDGLVSAANFRHGREVVDELGLSKSKPVSAPPTADGATQCQDDELKSLDQEEKRLWCTTHDLESSCATRMPIQTNFSQIDEWRRRDSRLNCWAKKQKGVALSSWESELFAAITLGTRSIGIKRVLMDLGYSCSVTVATDRQSVIDHSRRRGHSVASKDVGLRGLSLQGLVDGKLELEKVHTATNPADV